MRKTIFFLFCPLLVMACQKKAYDTENLIKEMTVLEDKISVPIGNFGPFTLELATNTQTAKAILNGVMETEEDGRILSKVNENFYKINAYEIIAKSQAKGQDMTKPFTYEIGDQETQPSGISSLLELFGFYAVDKHVVITANDPLGESYTMGGRTHISCMDKTVYKVIYDESFPLEGITIKRVLGKNTLLDMTLPDTVHFSPSDVGIKGGSLNLPANMMDGVYSPSNADFVFSLDYTCHVAVGEKLNLPLAMFGLENLTVKFKLPIHAYQFKDVEVSLDIENTLPFDVTLSKIQLMKGETPTVDENLKVSPESLVIKGGSLEKPTVTTITVNLKALEGSIPDITGVKISVAIAAAPDYVGTVLSVKQGISAKSSSATLRGGITLGANE